MAATAPPPRILLTGATGFIGGSVLTQLLASTSPSLRSAPITCLLRGADRAAKLKAAYGDRVNPVVYSECIRVLSLLIFHYILMYAGILRQLLTEVLRAVDNTEP